MQLRLIFLFLISSLTIPIELAFAHQIKQVVEIKSLMEIDKPLAKTMYLFDMDDTLFDFPYMIGSKGWRRYLRKATKNEFENWHDLFSLFLVRNYPVKTVEMCTSAFIEELQKKGHPVFALTARERNVWYDTQVKEIDKLTIRQLNSVGIDFDQESLNQDYPQLVKSAEYFKGIFFANTELKGDFLLELFKETSQFPEKIIFVDDKRNQAESVAAVLNALGIDNQCYWYSLTDEKERHFDPLIANIQLYYFWISEGHQIVSDEEAFFIAEQNPEKTAEYYLQQVLNDAKMSMPFSLRLKEKGNCLKEESH